MLNEQTFRIFILSQIKTLLGYPGGQVCVHRAALDLLSACDGLGIEWSPELILSLSDASTGDEASLTAINAELDNRISEMQSDNALMEKLDSSFNNYLKSYFSRNSKEKF
jgi:hypothetical protein